MSEWRAAAAILGFVLVLRGCGDVDGKGNEDKSAPPNTSSDKEQIQRLFATYNSALSAHRFTEVCSLSTPDFTEELVSEVREAFPHRRVTCEWALHVLTLPGDDQATTLRSIVVSGATASGHVGSSTNTWRFTRADGSWKVAYAN